MRRRKACLTALGAAAMVSTTHAAAGDWTADENGCKAWNTRPALKETVAWTGACVDGFADGRGQLRWTVNGKPTLTYEGDMKAGRRSGQGVMTTALGVRYEGGFLDDVYAGQGTLHFPSGARSHGTFVGGRLDGACALTWPDGAKYDGECSAGRAEGSGTIEFANGDRYAGAMRSGRPSGQGRYQWARGDSYEGGFANGQSAGSGVYRFADGSRYEGGFTGGQPAGRGRLEMADGLGYDGTFEAGVPTAPGSFFKTGAAAPENSPQQRAKLSLPYAKPQSLSSFREFGAVGMVCRKMTRPQLPAVFWKGQAVYRAVAVVREGRVVEVEISAQRPGVDPTAQKAFLTSIHRAMESYDCPGNHVFEQQFMFSTN